MTSSLGQTVQRFFERQLAPPAALRQSCSDEFERSMSRWLPPNKCDCRKRRNADHPFDPEIAPRRLLFFLSAERVSAGKRWLLGAAGNAVRAEGRKKMSPRRLKKCAAHQARQDGATAIMTRRRHYAARSLGVSALSIERRCRSVVWHRKKVRYKRKFAIRGRTSCDDEIRDPTRRGKFGPG